MSKSSRFSFINLFVKIRKLQSNFQLNSKINLFDKACLSLHHLFPDSLKPYIFSVTSFLIFYANYLKSYLLLSKLIILFKTKTFVTADSILNGWKDVKTLKKVKHNLTFSFVLIMIISNKKKTFGFQH